MSKSFNQYSQMWSDNNNDYWLIPIKDDYAIFKVSRNGFVTIEDNNDSKAVIQKLLSVNTKIVSFDKFNEYINTTFTYSDGLDNE